MEKNPQDQHPQQNNQNIQSPSPKVKKNERNTINKISTLCRAIHLQHAKKISSSDIPP